MAIQQQPELTARTVSAPELLFSQTDSDQAEDLLQQLVDLDLLIIEGLQYLPLRAVTTLTQLLDGRKANRRATVVTASVGPAGLKELPSRLTSRLASGLVVQLAPLPFPSRRLLAEHLTTRRKVYLTADALDLLAADPTGGGLRPLVGMIERVLLLAQGEGSILDAAEMTNLLREEPRRPDGF